MKIASGVTITGTGYTDPASVGRHWIEFRDGFIGC